KRSQNDAELERMGTTVVLLVVKEDKIYFGYVGDSRIYIMSSGKLYRLTKDHSYVQKLIDNGIISEDKAETHPKKSQLLKALGIAETVEPEVCDEPVLPKTGDKFLLCSDGLTGPVNDMNVQSILRNKEKTVSDKVNEMLNMALTAGGPDNISIQVIEVTKSNYKESKFINRSNKDLLTTSQIQSSDSADFQKTNTNIENVALTTLDSTEAKYRENTDKRFSIIDFLKSRNGLISVFIIILLAVFLIVVFSGNGQTENEYTLFLKTDQETEKQIKVFKDKETARQKADSLITEYKEKKLSIHSLTLKLRDSVIWDTILTVLPQENKVLKYAKYIIQKGDTWSSIWEDYKVCSIHIIEKNKEIFSNGEKLNPIAGKTIRIPLTFSADSSRNPEYWELYTRSEVGEHCENAKGNAAPKGKTTTPVAKNDKKAGEGKNESDDPKVARSEEAKISNDKTDNEIEGEETVETRTVNYTVKKGEGWRSIFSEYGVCPKYIKEKNEKGRDDNPLAEETLIIPLDKSCKEEYNPKFFENFEKNFGKCPQN
ncbi:MAG: protein phosphatase 2C domain-containing protein, partial [Bacteroidota bacterium]|nr:protein phosphatase 2C domain-containing protein [Bacteroidota bacterium]